MLAKRANLSEGRGAKPQIRNGWLGCRLEREAELLFGGIWPKGKSCLWGLPAAKLGQIRKEGPIVKETRSVEKKINEKGKEVRTK
jgi:hypothetical protein